MMPSLDVKKPLGLNLNKEGAALLVKGLSSLPTEDRNNVVFQRLMHDLNMIVTIWDRRIKNEKLIQEQKRLIKARQKAVKNSLPVSVKAPLP